MIPESDIQIDNSHSQAYKKVTAIKNLHRYYATRNINNAVTKYCHRSPKEIMVIIDGDDEIIGTQVFNMINAMYSKQKQNWIVYFAYEASDFGYGASKPLKSKYFKAADKARRKFHIFGALRTFYTELYMKISPEDHKGNDGLDLDTVYDDALQYPLFEMAGMERIEYIPQVLYFYNRFYGNNDDSNKKKQRHRQ